MDPQIAILITLVIYGLALLGIGLAARGRTSDSADFFIGGRRLGPMVASISASASSSSAWTLLAVSGMAYATGLSALWIFPACVGGFVINWYLLGPALRRVAHETGAVTVTELLAGAPGTPLRRAVVVIASLIVLVSLTTYVAYQFVASGKTFNETFGLPMWLSILIGGGVVLIYTVLGGFLAASLTDTLQGLLMVGACVGIPLRALVEVGGPAALLDGLRAVPAEGYWSLTGNAGPAMGVGLVLGLLGIGLGYPGQPHVVNRLMALRQGARELRIARRVAIGWASAVYAGMLILGWCGRLLFPGIADRDTIFLKTTTELCHPIVAGILLAAILSAIMSTADSQLLVAASAVAHDLPGSGGDAVRLLRRSRLVVTVICLAAIGAAMVLDPGIFEGVLFAWTALGASFGPLLLVRALRGPIPPVKTISVMVMGFALSVTFYELNRERLIIRDWAVPGNIELWLVFALALGILLFPVRKKGRSERCADFDRSRAAR